MALVKEDQTCDTTVDDASANSLFSKKNIPADSSVASIPLSNHEDPHNAKENGAWTSEQEDSSGSDLEENGDCLAEEVKLDGGCESRGEEVGACETRTKEEDGACAPEPPDPPDEVEQVLEDTEDDVDSELRSKEKHIFILSEAGKPIYSRYGSEERMVTLFGVMQAIVSCVADGASDEEIDCIEAYNKQYVFVHKRPLILVAVIDHKEPLIVIKRQLNYVHGVIVSVLTDAQLGRIFEQRANYDLRRLLGGADRLIESLMKFTECEPGTWLSSVPCLPLPAALRDHIKDAICSACSKIKNLVFALLIAENHLVMLVRMKKYWLHPSDLHLIMNLVKASESFKQSESWTPICLPSFDPSGFMHAHVSYLSEECQACLLLFNTDRDAFFHLSQAKHQIVQRLHNNGSLEALQDSMELFKGGVRLEEMGFVELRHLIYKQNSCEQHICSAMPNPYKQSDKESGRLMKLYRLLHTRVHSSKNPLKIYYVSLTTESILAWVTSGFELYATFEPLVSKNTAVNCVARVVKWVKREDDRFFIPSLPNF